MTTLNKPLTRRVDADCGRLPLAITIHPNGLIEFREKGSRRSYSIPAMACYRMAVQSTKPTK